MSPGLDTLLRDAGREPTIDLDVDSVHARGRRRSVTRRVAVGTGALVMAGVLAVGIPQLLGADRTELEPIDDAPPTEASDGTVVSVGTTARAALVAEAGRDLQLLRHEVGARALTTWTVERTRIDGTTDTRSLSLPPMVADPVVDRDGGVWSSDDGVLLRDGEQPSELAPELAGAWLPVGTDEAGNVVVTPLPGRGGDETPEGPLLHSLGTDGLVVPSPLDVVTAALPTDASVSAFDEGREHAVVLGSVASSGPGAADQLLRLVPYGGEPRDLLAEPPVAAVVGDAVVTMVHIVGDQVWLAVVDPDGGASSIDRTSRIVRVPLDPTDVEVTLLPTPDTAGMQRLDGVVISIDATEDGEVVLLGRTAVPEFPAPYVVRPDMADARADGAITELDARGVPTLLPATVDTAALAECATDGDATVNASPSGFGGQVWWLCWDATSQLPEDVAYPFVATELLSGGDGTADATEVEELLRAWAAGPDGPAAAAGLSGGIDAEVAEVSGVTIDGAAVTVDLSAGPQVGVLGTTTGGVTVVQGIVGTVLQYDALETVTITLDGSCEGWAAVVHESGGDASSCPTYDLRDAPWNQGLSGCALDLDAINAQPTPGEVVVWRWCPDATAVRPTTAPGEAFLAVPADVAVSSPPTETELRDLVVATLAPTDAEEAARGLEPAAGGLSRSPDTDDLAVVADGGTVTIDWSEDYVEVLPLSAPFPAGLVETAIAGAVLQFDAFDLVVFAIDGSCESYGATGEGVFGACIRLDRDHVLWAGSGSGGPAGPEDLRDGRVPALLSGVEPELGVLAVDVVQYLTGGEADDAYTADTGESGGPPNDYWIRNEDVFPEGVGVDPEADVQLVRLREDGDPDLDPGTLLELPDYLDEYGGEILVWLTVVNGEVTAVEEQYVP